jgi:hypothetical protein
MIAPCCSILRPVSACTAKRPRQRSMIPISKRASLAEEQQAWDFNISGVPAMIVEDKFLIPGAQAPEVYVNALRRVAEKTLAAAK